MGEKQENERIRFSDNRHKFSGAENSQNGVEGVCAYMNFFPARKTLKNMVSYRFC